LEEEGVFVESSWEIGREKKAKIAGVTVPHNIMNEART
jgi:hypothetical protein